LLGRKFKDADEDGEKYTRHSALDAHMCEGWQLQTRAYIFNSREESPSESCSGGRQLDHLEPRKGGKLERSIRGAKWAKSSIEARIKLSRDQWKAAD